MLPHAGLFITTNRTISLLIFSIEQLEELKIPPTADLDNKRAMCGASIFCLLLVQQQGIDASPPLPLSALCRKHQRCFIWMGRDSNHRVSQPHNLLASLVLLLDGAELLLADGRPSGKEKLKLKTC